MRLFWLIEGYLACGWIGYNIARIVALRKEIKELDREIVEIEQRLTGRG